MIREKSVRVFVENHSDEFVQQLARNLGMGDIVDGISFEVYVTVEIKSQTNWDFKFPNKCLISLEWSEYLEKDSEETADYSRDLTLNDVLRHGHVSRNDFARFLKEHGEIDSQNPNDFVEHLFIYGRKRIA